MSYVELAKIKDFLQITSTDYDNFLQSVSSYVESAINSYCGRDSFSPTTYSGDTGEVFMTDGEESEFYLTNTPVIMASGFGVSFNGTQYNSGDYEVNSKFGILKLPSPPRESLSKLKVEYTAGYDNIPADLQFAIVRIAQGIYNQAGGGAKGPGTGKKVKSESLSKYSVSYITEDTISELLEKESSVLDKYKRVNI